ncbi:MAG: bifunctional folylpolyglutamate synthase/dihydrofolate synthase, partial [Rhizobiaceae bacterium]
QLHRATIPPLIPTFFEFTTAMAFSYFAESSIDIGIIEVGLGGRFDATNVMKDVAVSVITPISLDHELHLGDTLAKIAFEKAGIIRSSTPLVCALQEDEAMEMIERQAARSRAPLLVSGVHFHAIAENGRFLFQDDAGLLDLALPRLPGPHQIDNAGAAIAATRAFARTQGFRLREAAIDAGIANASWPARMQRLTCGKLVELLPENTELWLDGGHNAGAAAMIARHFCELNDKHSRPLILICGMLSTKNPAAYFDHMAGLARKVYTVPVTTSESGIDPAELAESAIKSGIDAIACPGLETGLQLAAAEHDEMRVLIAGSLYTAGEALEKNGAAPG